MLEIHLFRLITEEFHIQTLTLTYYNVPSIELCSRMIHHLVLMTSINLLYPSTVTIVIDFTSDTFFLSKQCK